MWKKYKIALIFMLMTAGKGWAQQDPQFTQYMFNNLIYNPAFAGTVDSWEFTGFNRLQWASSEYANAPVTQTFSGNLPFAYKGKKMGGGLHIINDKLGIEKNFTIMGSYAYHLEMKKGTLSFGMQVGARQYRVNQDAINAYDKEDPIVAQGIRAPLLPEIGIGLLWRGKNYYAGFSSVHLTQSKIKYTTAFANSKLLRHFYLTGGYDWQVNTNIKIKPSIWLNFVNGAPFQGQISVLAEYKEMVWGGLGYRTGAAMTFYAGVNADKVSDRFSERIRIGYSFDMVLITGIPRFRNAGTHEIFITYNLAKKEAAHIPKFKRLE